MSAEIVSFMWTLGLQLLSSSMVYLSKVGKMVILKYIGETKVYRKVHGGGGCPRTLIPYPPSSQLLTQIQLMPQSKKYKDCWFSCKASVAMLTKRPMKCQAITNTPLRNLASCIISTGIQSFQTS